MLEVSNLSCVRGDRCLFRDVAFTLEPGELLYLHGHNGSGKTTLLRAVCGLILPDEGEVRWNGEDVRSLREDFTRDVLYLGHKNGIKGDLTGIENLRIGAILDGFGVSEQAAWDALERIGLDGHEDLPAKVLSQGQQRRVALARLLVNRARLWVLDEPFVALDKAAVELLQAVIRDHLANGGLVMLTTHQEVPLTSGHSKHLKLGWRG
ncbi:MAG: cytochrome c biogenesis heme-transporting ATPase CcmA [Gammaproteobacteria bacterium]|nr:cytochrome c biogenesis heme-transporting ATPase CcmA [Gammaproteobacteria bacterium]MBU1653628.1 cytochrome c biogenesis heme-transporting ATPase CcmA [Gammaproteobacteria bacterium]MBU1962704.1 cytochrome c biogenesis heme-transporting ATPase CcmA [Gammaproteobacteria bacterium]